jgi:membrane protein
MPRAGQGCRAADVSRLDGWIERYPLRIGRMSMSGLVVRIVRRFLDVRVTGLSAEMTYYALLSLFPLLGALGASLGFLERLAGREAAYEAEAAVLRGIDAVFSAEVTAEIIAPLIEGLLREERGGFAITSFLLTLFFASRVFRSAIEALDSTYSVEERRGIFWVWGLGLVFALAAVLTATVMVAMVVIGPLLGGGRVVADWLRLGPAYETLLQIVRLPAVFLVATGFLSLLYRFGPNVRNTWRETLPGALLGMAALVAVAVGFRYYIQITGLQSPVVADADDAILVALQLIGALMAALFWLWLSSMVVLAGGVVNAEVSRMREGLPPPAV